MRVVGLLHVDGWPAPLAAVLDTAVARLGLSTREGAALWGLAVGTAILGHTQPTSLLWPLGVYGLCVVGVVGAMLGLSHILGQRRQGPAASEPYESGVAATGSVHLRQAVKFYRLAIFFVVFDLEVVLLIGWAVAARELGWAGYGAAAVLVTVLLIALAYLWRLGALEWGTGAVLRRQRQEGARESR